MDTSLIIENTKTFVQQKLQGAEGGHDWFHTQRVYNNALLIARGETCDLTVVQLGALLHDVADSKFYEGDETVGPKLAWEFLESQHVPEAIIMQVVNIIENISFKGESASEPFKQVTVVGYALRGTADSLKASNVNFVVNGKKLTKEELNKIDPEHIKTVRIEKGQELPEITIIGRKKP